MIGIPLMNLNAMQRGMLSWPSWALSKTCLYIGLPQVGPHFHN
jgi:hypothetical protein